MAFVVITTRRPAWAPTPSSAFSNSDRDTAEVEEDDDEADRDEVGSGAAAVAAAVFIEGARKGEEEPLCMLVSLVTPLPAAVVSCDLLGRFKTPCEKTASISSRTSTEHGGAEENTAEGKKERKRWSVKKRKRWSVKKRKRWSVKKRKWWSVKKRERWRSVNHAKSGRNRKE